MSCLRENLTSSSYGEGLETDRATAQVPRQSLTRQLFFKALKQTLRIKTFVGTSANAVRTQVWTALIAMLLSELLSHISPEIKVASFDRSSAVQLSPTT